MFCLSLRVCLHTYTWYFLFATRSLACYKMAGRYHCVRSVLHLFLTFPSKFCLLQLVSASDLIRSLFCSTINHRLLHSSLLIPSSWALNKSSKGRETLFSNNRAVFLECCSLSLYLSGQTNALQNQKRLLLNKETFSCLRSYWLFRYSCGIDIKNHLAFNCCGPDPWTQRK